MRLKVIAALQKRLSNGRIFFKYFYNGDPRWTAAEYVADTIDHHELLGDFGIGFKYLKIAENEYTPESLLEMNNIVSTLFLAENHYQLEVLGEELLNLFEKEDQIAVSLR